VSVVREILLLFLDIPYIRQPMHFIQFKANIDPDSALNAQIAISANYLYIRTVTGITFALPGSD
jgi:hypothetical protein